MRFARIMLACIIAMGCIAGQAAADTQDLIDDGWELAIGGISTGVYPDTVSGTLDYPWNDAGDAVIEGDSAMYLGEQAKAYLRFADEPTFGSVSMLVYDKGMSSYHAHSTYGPRWGVMNNPAPNPIPAYGSPNDQVMGVTMLWKGFWDGNFGYPFNNSWTNNFSEMSSWFSITSPGNFDPPAGATAGQASRRVAGTLTTGNVSPDPLTNVQGAWARWTFEVHDGEDMIFKVADPDGSNEQQWVVIPMLDSIFDTGFSTTGFNQLFFYGGNTNGNGTADTVGLWIDDVVFTPDAGQGVEGFTKDFESIIIEGCPFLGSQGDFNCDTEVGLLDLDTLGQNWGAIGLDPLTSYLQGDATGDGEVGLLDLDIMGQNWGQLVSVPEPATLGLLAIASITAIRRR